LFIMKSMNLRGLFIHAHRVLERKCGYCLWLNSLNKN
jgi:hypothetical protein